MPVRDQKFAEPVSLSSTALADFPLPGRALELGFDLLGSRARRKEESMGAGAASQGVASTRTPQFAEIQLSTFPQQTVQLVDNRTRADSAARSERSRRSAARWERPADVEPRPL